MISQQQTQRQQLKILPQQIQLLNLYFLNSLELQQRIKNELEEIPGIGEKTATELLQEFRSVTKIKTLTERELTRVIGASKANIVVLHE